jgi:hypothetical protein
LQEDINHRSVALAINATKLTAHILAKAMQTALKQINQKRNSPQEGKQSVRQLAKGGSLQSIEISDENIKAFQPVARKYGVSYAVIKDTSTPKRYLVFFRAKDTDALTAAFKEFTAKTLAKSTRPSVRATIQKLLEASKTADRDKSRNKQHEGPQL